MRPCWPDVSSSWPTTRLLLRSIKCPACRASARCNGSPPKTASCAIQLTLPGSSVTTRLPFPWAHNNNSDGTQRGMLPNGTGLTTSTLQRGLSVVGDPADLGVTSMLYAHGSTL